MTSDISRYDLQHQTIIIIIVIIIIIANLLRRFISEALLCLIQAKTGLNYKECNNEFSNKLARDLQLQFTFDHKHAGEGC